MAFFHLTFGENQDASQVRFGAAVGVRMSEGAN